MSATKQSPWATSTISSEAQITTGAKNTQDREANGRYPFFVRSQDVERINSWSFDGEAVLTAGDGVNTGRIFHYINGKFDFHQRVYKISHFSPQLDGRFFYYWFSAHFYNRIAQMTAKSSVDSVRREMIADMELPLPPPEEQRAIARVLSDVDVLIDSLDALIAKKRDLKQATMQQVLTGKKRLPGFSEQWDDKTVSDLGVIKKGGGIPKSAIRSYGEPCILYGEIYTRYAEVVETLHSKVPKEIATKAVSVQKGDIVFAGSGETAEEIGKCVAYLGEATAYAGGDTLILRPVGHDSRFLGYLLNSRIVNQQKANRGQGSSVVHLYGRDLKTIEIRLPHPTEQTAIAEVLSGMDTELNALVARREKTQLLKTGLMQELLSGRLRLV